MKVRSETSNLHDPYQLILGEPAFSVTTPAAGLSTTRTIMSDHPSHCSWPAPRPARAFRFHSCRPVYVSRSIGRAADSKSLSGQSPRVLLRLCLFSECRCDVGASASEALDETLEIVATSLVGMIEPELLETGDDVVERGDDVDRQRQAALR
jgi:hypothetical protein